MPYLMDWKETIRRWRALSPEEQTAIRLRRLPDNVARSIAFEGEPVDEEMLERHLRERLTQRDS